MADYTGYLKVALNGVAGGQNIVNLLYYGNEGGEAFVFNDSFMAAFNAEWADTFATDWCSHYPDTYTLANLTTWAVNYQGEVISDNPAILAIGEPGVDAGALPSPAVTAILSIQTASISSEGTRSLRRSYLAIGPVPEVHVESTGAITIAGMAEYTALAALVAQVLVLTPYELWPVRIGRTVAPAIPAVGTIVSVIPQPYVSFRKSRKLRPNGT